MTRITYAYAENLLDKVLYEKLTKLDEQDSKYHQLASYHRVKLTDKELFDLYQVWHDNTHMCKRTIFCIPKAKAKQVCKLYEEGNKKQLEHMLNTLIAYAVKL